MRISVIVKAKVKEYAKLDGKQLNVSSDFSPALEEKVKKIIEQACIRAKENFRNTVMKKDL